MVGDTRHLTDGLKRFYPTEAKDFVVQGVHVQQQYDDYGNHRICVEGCFSFWYSFQKIAKTGNYRGCTEYWGGVFPPVFRVIPHD